MSLLALLESMQPQADLQIGKRPPHAVEPAAGTLSREIWDRIGEDWTTVGEVTAPWRGRRKSVHRYLLEFMDRGLVERRGKHSKTEYRRTVMEIPSTTPDKATEPITKPVDIIPTMTGKSMRVTYAEIQRRPRSDGKGDFGFVLVLTEAA